MSNHYNTLGVVPTADSAVVKAAYRAMAAIYHPDKNTSIESIEKIKEISIAYDTLSDPDKRKEYDNEMGATGSAESADFDNIAPLKETQIEKAWSMAEQFHPVIRSDLTALEKISWRLAFAFKLKLIEGQAFDKSREVAQIFKNEYLPRFFGNDPQNLFFAENLIKSREISAAIYLNEIINVMGSSVLPRDIRRRVLNQFKEAETALKKTEMYANINNSSYFNYHQAELLVNMHGGVVTRKGVFKRRVYLHLAGEHKSFESDDEFASHIKKFYEREYA